MGELRDKFDAGVKQGSEDPEVSPSANVIGQVLALIVGLGLLYVMAYIIGAGLSAGGLG